MKAKIKCLMIYTPLPQYPLVCYWVTSCPIIPNAKANRPPTDTPDTTPSLHSVRQAVMEERLVAGGSLAGWIRMVRKALNVESGKVDQDSVRERLKSLDTAWDKFDQAHQKLMNSEGHYKKEEMKEEWEKQMEEYCLVKEEAIATLKKSDNLKVG